MTISTRFCARNTKHKGQYQRWLQTTITTMFSQRPEPSSVLLCHSHHKSSSNQKHGASENEVSTRNGALRATKRATTTCITTAAAHRTDKRCRETQSGSRRHCALSNMSQHYDTVRFNWQLKLTIRSHSYSFTGLGSKLPITSVRPISVTELFFQYRSIRTQRHTHIATRERHTEGLTHQSIRTPQCVCGVHQHCIEINTGLTTQN